MQSLKRENDQVHNENHFLLCHFITLNILKFQLYIVNHHLKWTKMQLEPFSVEKSIYILFLIFSMIKVSKIWNFFYRQTNKNNIKKVLVRTTYQACYAILYWVMCGTRNVM